MSDEDKEKNNILDDSESIKNQRRLLLEEINKRSDFILYDEYCDEDLSGAGTFRPEFERLISDCEKGKIDVVLCKSQSRFSRDMEIIEKYIHNKFVEWNIRFIGLVDNADTEIIGNKKARQINGLVNEWYLEDVSLNIRSAFQAKMKQGEFISPFAAYGYLVSQYDNNKLVIDPVAAKVVKKIYQLYLKGLGYTGIAKYLNSNNIPSPSLYKYRKGIKLNIISSRPREEIKWSANAIRTILTNELYIGNLVQGKRTTISYKNHKIKTKDKNEWICKENTHNPIIEKEIFQKVQKAIKERTKPIKKSNMFHLFSGKVYCLECQKVMRKKTAKNHSYLVCSSNKDGYNECLNKKAIRYDLLEKIILKEINKLISKYYDQNILKEILYQNISSKANIKLSELENQRQSIIKSINDNCKYLKALYEDKVNGLVPITQYKELADYYLTNKEFYNKQKEEIDNKIHLYKTKTENNVNENLLKKYTKINKLNKYIIDEFIKQIIISKINAQTNERSIEIIWNFE